MKIWFKYLIAIGAGGLLSLLLPDQEVFQQTLNEIAIIFINIGKYAVSPLLFFSIIITVYELKNERKLFKTLKKYLLGIGLFTILCAFLGTVGGIFLPANKLPIITSQILLVPKISIIENIKNDIFPANLWRIFIQNGFSFFPLLILAFLIGLSLDYEKQFTRPVLQLTDGLSRIMYHINSLIIEVLWLALIIISATRFFNLRNLQAGESYLPFLLILLAIVSLVIFIFIPLFLYFLHRKKNPFHLLYAALSSALLALFTGDSYLATASLLRCSKDNMSISRKISSPLFSLSLILSKAGTALVVSLSLILLRKSTLGGDIPFLEYIWIYFASIGASIFSALISTSFPQTGAYAALAFLCFIYIQPALPPDKYLDLSSLAFIILGTSALLDTLISAVLTYKTSQDIEKSEDIDISRTI